MGCCESCFEKNDEEPNAQTRLLQPEGNIVPVNATDPVNASYDYPDATPVGSVAHSKQDELSMLSNIIQQYNTDVIDITSLDSKIDAVEYMNRVQTYNRKVAALSSSTRMKVHSLYSSGNDPVPVLASQPTDYDDVMLITQLSNDLRSAFNSVKITKHKELVLSLAHR